ncbi:MAG TPA: carotenoid oxygenase family protein [Kitasatospora aureofaciens]|nr:carotenoid oxygenase family protein [Kitasatospora aureofaciens]HJD84399.1 carotenoid oxygenase family protein [Kitasatospora aureofaciens]
MVIDASGLDRVATVHLPHRVAAGLHGSWIPDTDPDGAAA